MNWTPTLCQALCQFCTVSSIYCILYSLWPMLPLSIPFFFFFCHTLRHAASWFPDQGLNLCPAVEAQSLNHWTTRKVPLFCTLLSLLFLCGLKICRQSLVFKNNFNKLFYETPYISDVNFNVESIDKSIKKIFYILFLGGVPSNPNLYIV